MSHPEKLGPYTIDHILGSGGMGTVYAGTNLDADEEVAVKVLNRALGTNDAFRERFSSEVEALKKLDHPNIVRLLGYGEEDGLLFYSMELVEGGSLHDEILQRGRFEWKEVIDISIQICQALKHAHDYGIIHRDIKPANLMRTSDNVIKLSDFGIAKLFGGQHTNVGSVIGTADYMAPEQAEGRPVSSRSDLYSLGSVMYALLSQRPPFTGGSVAEVLHALKYSEPTPIRRLVPGIPEELEIIIHQLLEKDPQDRVANAYTLANRLKAMQFGLAQPTQIAEIGEVDDPQSADGDSDATRYSDNTNETGVALDVDSDPGSSPSGSSEEMHESLSESDATRLDDGTRKPTPVSIPAVTSFKTVDEEERRQAQSLAQDSARHDLKSTISLVIALLGVVMLAGFGWWISQPLSADDLFERIASAAENGAAGQAETEIDSFLQQYSQDERAQLVQQYRESIQIDRFAQHMRLRLKGFGSQRPLSAAERAYLDALQHENVAPELAVEKYTAIIAVFGQNATATQSTSDCVQMARRKLEILTPITRESERELAAAVEAEFQAAREIEPADPAKAKATYRGIIQLYEPYSWADSVVKRAQARLQQP